MTGLIGLSLTAHRPALPDRDAMLPCRPRRAQAPARCPTQRRPHEAEDVLDGIHRLGRDRRGARRTVGQDTRRYGRDRRAGGASRRRSARAWPPRRRPARALKPENCAPPMVAQHIGRRRRRSARRRSPPGSRPRAGAFRPSISEGSGSASVLRLADLLGDRVGIVGEVDARIVGGVRFRHLLRAVAQRHDARRRARRSSAR